MVFKRTNINASNTIRLYRIIILALVLIIVYQYLNLVGTKNPEQDCHPNKHSVCFIGKRFCHPGYTGELCDEKLVPANPWYTADCKNLKQDITFDIDMPLETFFTKDVGIIEPVQCSHKVLNGITECAYLCFSHPVSGVPQIPIAFWKRVQENEASVWKGWGVGSNDRGAEHLEGFMNYKDVPENLGNYIEVGSGPFTQTQFIINRTFEHITLLDPGIEGYLRDVPGCAYINGTLDGKKVRLLKYGAEKLSEDEQFGNFDTLLAINVIDHIWDAYQFLSNLYNALKPGGILIYHDKFSVTPLSLNPSLGEGNRYHPIRVSRHVFKHFFDQFDTIYMFDGETQVMRDKNWKEVGYYFIGRKREKQTL